MKKSKRLVPGTGGYADDGPPKKPKIVTFLCEDCRDVLPWKQAPAHLHGRPILWLAGIDLRDEEGQPAFSLVPRKSSCIFCGEAIPTLFAHLHDPRSCVFREPRSPAMEAWLGEAEKARQEGRLRPPLPTVTVPVPREKEEGP